MTARSPTSCAGGSTSTAGRSSTWPMPRCSSAWCCSCSMGCGHAASSRRPEHARFARCALPAYTGAMKLAVLALLAACQSGGGDDYPTGPGGGGPIVVGGGGGGAGGDARTSDGGDSDAGVELTGRVCILKDLRQPTVCD